MTFYPSPQLDLAELGHGLVPVNDDQRDQNRDEKDVDRNYGSHSKTSFAEEEIQQNNYDIGKDQWNHNPYCKRVLFSFQLFMIQLWKTLWFIKIA